MISMASGGTTERMAARIWSIALRAGFGTAARYALTVSGAVLLFGTAFVFTERRFRAACFAGAFFAAAFSCFVFWLFRAPLLFVAELRLPWFAFFMRAMLSRFLFSVYASPGRLRFL